MSLILAIIIMAAIDAALLLAVVHAACKCYDAYKAKERQKNENN